MPQLHQTTLAPIRSAEPSFLVSICSNSDAKADLPTFNAANFSFVVPNSALLQQVSKVVPVMVRISNSFVLSALQPTFPQIIYVALDGTLGGNMVDTKTGVAYEILCALPIDALSARSYTFYGPDLFLWDIDYHTPRDLSRVSIKLLDENFTPIHLDSVDQSDVPMKTSVTLILKCFHRAFVR
jgi:hypothetical protein